MPHQLPSIFIANSHSFEAITKRIYDYFIAQGYDVVYFFTDDIHIDFDTAIKPHLLSSNIVIAIISEHELENQFVSNHFPLILDMTVEDKLAIIPLMFGDDTWQSANIKKNLQSKWQSVTTYTPIQMNFVDFTNTLDTIQQRIGTTDYAQDNAGEARIKFIPTAIEIEDIDNALLAEEALDKGLRAYTEKDYILAKQHFDSAIALNTLYDNAYNNRALTHTNLSMPDEAFKDIKKAININRSSSIYYSNCAFILLGMPNIDNDLALQAVDKALKLDKANLPAYTIRGQIHGAMNDYKAAIGDYTTALRLNPSDYISLNNRGLLYEKLNNHTAALADYTLALDIEADAVIYKHRALLYIEMDMSELALADINEVIELHPDNGEAYFLLGVLLASQEKYREAVRRFDRAIELEYSNPEYYLHRGLAYVQLFDTNEAYSNIMMALDLDPENQVARDALNDLDAISNSILPGNGWLLLSRFIGKINKFLEKF